MPGSLIFIFNWTSNFSNLNFNRPRLILLLLAWTGRYWQVVTWRCNIGLYVCTLYNSNYYHVNTDPIIITADTDNPEPGVVRKYQVHFQWLASSQTFLMRLYCVIICNIMLIILAIIDAMDGRLNQKNSFTYFKSLTKDQVISSCILELAPTIHAISNIGIELCAYANTCIPS